MAKRKLNITLTIPGLGCGGAERVLSRLANRLAARGHSVTALAIRPDPVFYKIDDRVTVQQANITSPESAGGLTRAMNVVRRALWLRCRIIASKPDVVIAFEDVAAALTLFAIQGTRIPVIVSERVNPEYHSIPGVYEKLRASMYPKAAAVVMQTSDLRDWAAKFVGESRVRIIPNPVFVPQRGGDEPRFFDEGKSHLLAAGRLTRQKGFDILIEAFGKIADKFPHWNLVILGEGEDREKLMMQVNNLELYGRVLLPGNMKNIAAAYAMADMFVMSSRYEGFPNALCEAMACGMPVISFDCPSGPADIINDGEDGLLVPPENATALADAMAALMDSPKERRLLGRNAQDIVQRFGETEVMKMWEDLITDVTTVKGKSLL